MHISRVVSMTNGPKLTQKRDVPENPGGLATLVGILRTGWEAILRRATFRITVCIPKLK